MACPGCGEFQLFLDRTNGKPKIECRGCGLAGVKPVQAAFDAWGANHEAALQREANLQLDAMSESSTSEAMRRQHRSK